MTIYGRMVAAGEWRDYALDFLEDAAVFSIFRRSSEMPLFRVEKRPRLKSNRANMRWWRRAAWCCAAAMNWRRCLKIFDKKLLKALAAE